MTRDETDTIFTALGSLLERERAALLAGELEQVTELLEEKAQLIDRLAQIPAEDRRLQELRGKAQRNEHLLESTLEGIRAVAQRLSTIRRLRGALETYDQRGQRLSLPAADPNRVERRA